MSVCVYNEFSAVDRSLGAREHGALRGPSAQVHVERLGCAEL